MRQGRTFFSSRNIIFGICLKAYQTMLPFVIRTVMIRYMGMEYTGIGSLFASILSVLNLAELGVGSAMVYSMYKPIAEGDDKTVCALLKLYKFYYRIIGMVICVAGIVILPFVPKLINGTVPDGLNVYILYLQYLAATVFSYWLFAYKNSLLNAYQRNDVISKIQIATCTIQYGTQILAIISFKNYYIYLTVTLLIQILNNILTNIVSNKMYPKLQPEGNLPESNIKQINGEVKDIFTSKVGGVIVSAADSIVISAVLGLLPLALYQNYFSVVSAVIGFISVAFVAVTAGIGNAFVTESREKVYDIFRTVSLLCFMAYGVCVSCFLCLFQPFMKLWVGEENMLTMGMVIMFCLYFYVREMMNLFSLYKDGAGIWHQDRFRPLIEAGTNLVLNLILVRFIGLYGILLSTIISMAFVSLPWLYGNLFKYVFQRSSKSYLVSVFGCLLIIAAIAAADYFICSFIPDGGILFFVVRMFVCVTVSVLLHFFIFSRFKRFKSVVDLINRAAGGKLDWFVRKYNKS